MCVTLRQCTSPSRRRACAPLMAGVGYRMPCAGCCLYTVRSDGCAHCRGAHTGGEDGATLYMMKHLSLPANLPYKNKEHLWRQLKEEGLTIDRDRHGKASEGARARVIARSDAHGRAAFVRALVRPVLEKRQRFDISVPWDPSWLRCGSRVCGRRSPWRRWPASCRGRSCRSSPRRTTLGVSSHTRAAIRVERRTSRREFAANPTLAAHACD